MLFCFHIFQKQGINMRAGECYIEEKKNRGRWIYESRQNSINNRI